MVTLYESIILPQFKTIGLEYKITSSVHRALQKLLILAVLVLINKSPAVVYTSIPHKSTILNIDDVWKNSNSLSIVSVNVLTLWMSFATKLIGTMAVVTFTRLYVVVGISTYQLLTYIPNNEYLENKNNSFTELDDLNNNVDSERKSREWR